MYNKLDKLQIHPLLLQTNNIANQKFTPRKALTSINEIFHCLQTLHVLPLFSNYRYTKMRLFDY
jgi:hypothetical protein